MISIIENWWSNLKAKDISSIDASRGLKLGFARSAKKEIPQFKKVNSNRKGKGKKYISDYTSRANAGGKMMVKDYWMNKKNNL